MKPQRPSKVPFQKKEIAQVFLGIDFGTSYTKVSYSYAPTTNRLISTIKWGDSFFKESILYLKNERIYFEKPCNPFNEIRYFKFSIIEKQLLNTRINTTKNNFEKLCCVYFLTHVIKRSLETIQSELKIEDLSKIKITVNMGAPLESFDYSNYKTELYESLLKYAVILAGGNSTSRFKIPENQVTLSSLDEVYSRLQNKNYQLTWTYKVFPELVVEMALYHESTSIPENIYVLVDIGGGTVDMAVLQKKESWKKYHLYCLGQKILPYGVEILQKKDGSISEKKFQEAFISMVIDIKAFDGVNLKEINRINIFFLGGGSTNPWYQNTIAKTESILKKSNIPPLDTTMTLDHFISGEEMLREKNQRLIISQMLARDESEIPKILGFPEHFRKQQANNQLQKIDMDERKKSLYGN